MKTVYPPQTKFAGGVTMFEMSCYTVFQRWGIKKGKKQFWFIKLLTQRKRQVNNIFLREQYLKIYAYLHELSNH